VKFLKEKKVSFQEIPIREQPPTLAELKKMLKDYNGDLRKLFNTSGLDYRKLGLGEKLPTMTLEDSLMLLSKNGNLVKRPFLLTDRGIGLVGFKEEEWEKLVKTL
jgi:arsenate reductase